MMILADTKEPISRTARKRAARRTRILETAMRMAAADGLAALTVQRLAAALDYTPGALYRYFPSKHALLGAMQRHALVTIGARLAAARVEWAAWCDAALVPTSARALFELVATARAYIGLTDELPEHMRLVNNLLGDPRVLVEDDQVAHNAPVLLTIFDAVDRLWARAVEVEALEPGDPRPRTIALWAALQGISQLGKLARFDPALFAPRVHGDTITRGLLRGFGADASAVDAAFARHDAYRSSRADTPSETA